MATKAAPINVGSSEPGKLKHEPRIDFVNSKPVPQIRTLRDLKQNISLICENIFRALGSQQLEATYQRCLKIDLERAGVGPVAMEVEIPIVYNGEKVGTRRADMVLVVEKKLVVIETKAVVNGLNSSHLVQLENYMDYMKATVGLLINFPHDAGFPVVGDDGGSVFCQEVLSGNVETLSDRVTRCRNNGQPVQVVVVKRGIKSALKPGSVKQAIETIQQKKQMSPGITKEGEPCKICLKRNQLCHNHRDHSPAARVRGSISHLNTRSESSIVKSSSPTQWGITKAGTSCKICARQRRFCHQHVQQSRQK